MEQMSMTELSNDLDNAEEVSPRRAGKMSREVSSKHIESAMEKLSLSANEMCNAIGVGPGTVHNWLRKGRAPKWTLLATECLLRRNRLQETSRLFLVKVTEDIETFEKIVGAFADSYQEIE